MAKYKLWLRSLLIIAVTGLIVLSISPGYYLLFKTGFLPQATIGDATFTLDSGWYSMN